MVAALGALTVDADVGHGASAQAQRWLCRCPGGDSGEMGHRSGPAELIWLNAPGSVPTSAVSRSHTIIKRIGQHAAALRLVMPHVNGSGSGRLFRRCQPRELPVN